MAKEAVKREGKQLLLRFPERSDLRERLSVAADQNNRSLSAEIIFRLEVSLQEDAGVPDFVTSQRIDDLESDVATLRAEVRALAAKMKFSGDDQ